MDPGVWVALQSLIEARKADTNELLNVDTTFALPPESSANRILAVDAALRTLLASSVSHADLEKRFFASSGHVLRRLAELHVIFYNHDTKYVEMESPLTQRVVSALLSSKDHELSMQLVRQSLAWQAADKLEAHLGQQMAGENRSEPKSSRITKLESELDAARKQAKLLLQSLEATRASLLELRR